MSANHNFVERRTALVGPDPVVTRHDDGTLTVDWRTADGQPPSLPILVHPELLLAIIKQLNEKPKETA